MKKRISLIITTKNSAKTISTLLKSLIIQSYKPVEIIVVDNGSTDNTLRICSNFKVKIYQKGPERSAQRNFGAKVAKGDYLFFLDSDMILTKNVLKACADLIDKQKYLGGIIVPEKSFGRGIWAKAKALEREINEGENFFEAARLFPKKIFWQFKGYDENITGPEDWDLPQRISKKKPLFRITEYIKHNEGELNLMTLFKKKYYYGLSAYKYLKKQKISTISSVTIYFLRPGFYRNWRKLFKKPSIFLAMVIMLTFETIGGGLGYFQGRFLNK